MSKYEILDHPADLKIRVYGKTLAEVFVNAALALAQQQTSALVKSSEPSEEIIVEAADLESLLVDWLSEILYRSEVNKKVYNNFEILKFSENPLRVEARIKGVEAKKQIDIKAATYHGLEIKKSSRGWEAIITFDI